MPASARWLPALLVFAAVGCIPTTASEGKPDGEDPGAAKSDAVELKAVKFEQLGAAVRAHRGKVVVVDFWATYCGPCMKEFHHLVELHDKYASGGLVCMSVSVDLPENEGKALAFLKKSKATFPNYRLDEEESVWPEKLLLSGVPAVYVFDREGRRVKKFTQDDPDNQFDYAKDVVPLVGKLMGNK